MAFSLDKALDIAIDFGSELFFGKKSSAQSDIGDAGDIDNTSDRSGGFLSSLAKTAVKSAVRTYGSSPSSPEQAYQSDRMSLQQIKNLASANSRFAGRIDASQSRGGFRPTNIRYLDALRRRMENPNYDANFERRTSRFTIAPRPTIGGGAVASVKLSDIKRGSKPPSLSTTKT